MTLATICTNALVELGDLETPSTFAGSTNKTAKLLVQMANTEVADLYRRHDWQVLMKDHTFTTVASQESYALPSDFDRYAPSAYQDRSNRRTVFGPITAEKWQQLKRTNVQSGIYRYFRLRGNQILFFPTPTRTGDTIVFEYISNTPVESAAQVAQQRFQADTDVPLLDEYLITIGVIWRVRRVQGLRYDAEKMRYEQEVQRAVARDKALPVLNFGKKRNNYFASNLPEDGFGV